ncbi:MAG: hypothetical protein ACLSA6_15160 [Holdemania massiliensis]
MITVSEKQAMIEDFAADPRQPRTNYYESTEGRMIVEGSGLPSGCSRR